MRLFADESVEGLVTIALRAAGHQVTAAADVCPGASDESVLAFAERTDAVLVTNDKDFAQHAFLQQQARRGIVLVRLPRWRSKEKAARVVQAIADASSGLRRHMLVIEESTIRRRRLPGT